MPATLPDAARGQVEPLPGAYRAVDHPDVGDLFPADPALDLEHPARRRGVRLPVGGRQQGLDPVHEVTHAGSGDRRAGVHRVQDPGSGLFRQRRTQLVGGPGQPLDVGREQRVIVLGQRRRLPVAEGRVLPVVGPEAGGTAARLGHRAHGQHVRRQPRADRGQDRAGIRAHPVHLVDEQQGRHV
jgi:hypothetical protein